MKKSLVALAILSVVGSAFADVDVSGGIKMYGVIDQAVTSQTLTDPSVANRSVNYTSLFAASATSRIGFKGSRDLGDGVKGRIQAEIQVEPDNSTQLPARNRQTFVGISKESVGEILLGTQETTAYEIFGMDVNGRVEYKPQVWRTTASSETQDRANNALKYVSPEIAGFTAHVMKGFADATNSASTFTSAGLKYQQDKIKAAYVVDQLTNSTGSYKFAGLINAGPSKEGATWTSDALVYAGTTTTTITRNIGSITYDFGPASVNYIYAKSYNSTSSKAGSLLTNTLGIRVPYDQFAFAMSYGAGTIDSYTSTAATKVAGDGNITDTTFGMYYNLDKATSFYLLGSTSTLSSGAASVQAGKNVTYAIGARYNF